MYFNTFRIKLKNKMISLLGFVNKKIKYIFIIIKFYYSYLLHLLEYIVNLL